MSHVYLYIYLGKISPALLENLRYNSHGAKTYIVGQNLDIKDDWIETIEWRDFTRVINPRSVMIIESNPYKLCDFKPFFIFWFETFFNKKIGRYAIMDLDLRISKKIVSNYLETGFYAQKNFAHFRLFIDVTYQLDIPVSLITNKNMAFDERSFYNDTLSFLKQHDVNGFDVDIYSRLGRGRLLSAPVELHFTDDLVLVDGSPYPYLHVQKRKWSVLEKNTNYYLDGFDFVRKAPRRSFLMDLKYLTKIIVRRIKDKMFFEAI